MNRPLKSSSNATDREPASSLQRIAQTLSCLLTLGLMGRLHGIWNNLPETIPTHFDLSGNPNGWGPKQVLILFPIISIALTAGSLLPGTFKQHVHLPFAFQENTKPRALQIACELVSIVMLESNLMIYYLTDVILSFRKNASVHLDSWFIPVTIGFLSMTILLYMKRLKNISASP